MGNLSPCKARGLRLWALAGGSAAVLCLFAGPAWSGSAAIGGGTITWTGSENPTNANPNGSFDLSPANGDLVTVTGVTIKNTTGNDTNQALFLGNPAGLSSSNPQTVSSGSFTVQISGSTLSGQTPTQSNPNNPNGGSAVFAEPNGNVTLDTTMGTANTITGGIVLVPTGTAGVNLGPDTITAATGAALSVSATSHLAGTQTPNVTINSNGASLTAATGDGIDANGFTGAVSIGAANGGFQGKISAAAGWGIAASDSISQTSTIVLGANGSINAKGGITVTTGGGAIDSFGSITASGNPAISIPSGTVTLESTSTTSGAVTIASGTIASASTPTVTIAGGANIANATFNLGTSPMGGLALTGTAPGTLDVSTVANAGSLTKLGAGTWTLARSAGAGVGATPITISGGTVVGTTSSITSSTISTAAITTLQFDQTISGTFAGMISGAGGLTKSSSGSVTLTGSNTYTGVTNISAGTLALSGAGSVAASSAVSTGTGTFDISGTTNGATITALNGGGNVTLGSKPLTITNASQTLSGVISGTGSITIAGGSQTFSGANTYTGTTIINNGATLSLGGNASIAASGILDNGTFLPGNSTNAAIGGLAGSGSVVMGSQNLFITAANGNFSGVISGFGTGEVIFAGGNQILSGVNTEGGFYEINPGATLTLGAGGTTGSVAGNIVDNGLLIYNQSGTVIVKSILSGTLGYTLDGGNTLINPGSGPGALSQIGSGTVILDGPGAFTGTSSVSNGVLEIGDANTPTAFLGGGANVASGGTLAGYGTIKGAVSVASGGILTPGAGGTPGTLTVTGNLTLASGASYVTYITPSAAGLTAVTGTASVGGALTANAGSGTYTAGQTYKLITATAGVSGTFTSLSTPGLPNYVTSSLSYDANDVILNLNATSLSSQISTGTTTGSTGTGSSSSSATGSTGTTTGNTGTSSSSSSATGSTSTGTSSTSSSTTGSTGASTLAGVTTNQASISNGIDAGINKGAVPNSGIASLFSLSGAGLQTALNQVSGVISAQVSQAFSQSFSPFFNLLMERGRADDGGHLASAGVPQGVKPAQLEDGAMDVWGSVYGGHIGISANAASGAPSLSSNSAGLAAGVEARFGDLLAGTSIGVGHQAFHSSGNGKSNDVLLAFYGRENIFEAAYVSAAFGFGWHTISTLRSVTVSGNDVLMGKLTGTDFGGRIEAGDRIGLDDAWGVTPFVAFAGQSFHTPAYAETAVSGTTNFALAYAANDSPTARSELGARLGRDFALDDGTLSLEGTLGWGHQLQQSSSAQAAFETLPNSGFVVLGVRPATNTALLGLDLEARERSGFTYGVQIQGQAGAGTNVMSGMLNLGYHL